ncbi:hypothetical protein TNIN_99711 [Trichonephila inaurata madagascariensis]|uniref:Uncharacterized protein n=1 Tax=Trichonephila inaurata madagascariensis TaxID=2747483 RepID=A0A8X6I736_9ARAC|nr:hypothetical protein TNIN_99711 [Trichonephila inaurata madagascariensis]
MTEKILNQEKRKQPQIDNRFIDQVSRTETRDGLEKKDNKGRRNDERKDRQEIEGLEGIVEVLQSSEQPHRRRFGARISNKMEFDAHA